MPQHSLRKYTAERASIRLAPWAKLMMCNTPYTSVRPTAIKAYTAPVASPLSSEGKRMSKPGMWLAFAWRFLSGFERKDRVDLGLLARDDGLDVVLHDLRHQRLRALVLAVDELRRAIRHDVVREVALAQRVDDRGAFHGLGAPDGIGQQPHGGVGHEDLVAEELALGLHALAQLLCALVLRVEPMVAVDDAVGRVREFLHELVA